MKGWGMTASPPWSWIASTVSSRLIRLLTGRSRNQPTTCVWAGHRVVISCPRTTARPASSPRTATSAAAAMVSWSQTAIRSRPAATAARTRSAGSTIPSDAVVWQYGSATPKELRRGGLAVGAEDGLGEAAHVEGREVGETLPDADHLGRHPELALEGHHRTTP